MSSEIKLREDTKKIVTSLLLSAPKGRTVRELCDDYHEWNGFEIPFKKMGYLSANEYFEDLKGTVHKTWVNGELVLRAVGDESTQHIQRMVSRQRVPSKKSKVSAKKQTKNMNRAGHAPNVPPFVRKCINELMLAYPDGILATNFMSAYSRRFGQQLLFQKMGFASLRDLLRSLTGMLDFAQLSGGAYRIMLKQSTSARKKLPPAYNTSSSSSHGPSNNNHRQHNHKSQADSMDNWRDPGKWSKNSGTNSRFAASPHIPEDIQLNITKVLKVFQYGLCSNRMLREYKKINGQELPLASTGHVSVVEFLSELPHLVVITRPTKNGDWLLFEPEIYAKQANGNNSDKSSQKLDWQNIVKTIVDRYPEGMPLRLLPDRFKADVGVDLNPLDYDFTNLEDMVRSIDGKFVIIELSATNVVIFPMSHKPVNEKLMSNSILLNLDKVDIKSFPMNYREEMPPDSVGANVRYTVQKIPQSFIGAEDYFDVFVSQVDSPGRLYIQLKAATTTDALEDLMDELESVYCGPEGAKYRMPDFMYQEGQVCAAVFPEDDNWHRCCITKVSPEKNMLEVYFVDYGNRSEVKKENCRLLKSKFIRLPAQAVQSKLANIMPANGHKWTKSSQQRVLQLVSNKCILAMVLAVENRVCNVCLCDTTTGEEDIHINDVMCYEGHAVFVPDDAPEVREFDLESTPPSSISGHEEIDSVSQTDKVRPALGQLSSLLNRSPEKQDTSAHSSLSTNSPENNNGNASLLDNSFESEDEDEYIRYVVETKLPKFGIVHMINYGGTAYLHSSEISSYLWDSDCLKMKLRQKRLIVPKVMVSREDDPELFEEFKFYKVKGTIDEEGKCVVIATLYELKSVPRILQAFSHPNAELIELFKELHNQFDPDDPYWQGADEDPQEVKARNENELKNLEQTLRLLLFRKKLYENEQDSQNLKEVEDLVERVNKSIEQLKAEDKDSHCIMESKTSQIVENSAHSKESVSSTSVQPPQSSAPYQNGLRINQAMATMHLNQNAFQQQAQISYPNHAVNGNMVMQNNQPARFLQSASPIMRPGPPGLFSTPQTPPMLPSHPQMSGMNLNHQPTPFSIPPPPIQTTFGRGQIIVNNMAALNNGLYNHHHHQVPVPGNPMMSQTQFTGNPLQFMQQQSKQQHVSNMNPYAPSFRPSHNTS